MSVEWVSGRLILLVAIAGAIVGVTLPGAAEEKAANLLERDRPATTVKEWMAQVEAAIVRVTGVRVNRTPQGLQVVLVTESGQPLQATQQANGNTLVLTVPNAVLDGQAFEAEKPVEGIDRVSVTQADATTIRVSITGLNDLPNAEIVPGQGLVLAVTPEEGIEEEVTVTGDRDNPYRVPNASVGTRTDTPLRDVPRSIQVIPQQVIKDQGATRITEVLRNVPGASSSGLGSPRRGSNEFDIRGFYSGGNILVNGLQDRKSQAFANFGSNIERVEVIKGPASVLFGQGAIGGTVNLVTKKPLLEPFYSFEASAGSFNSYSGAIDFSDALNEQKTVAYRLNASIQTNESFIDFFREERYLVAPVLSFSFGDSTKLTIEGSFKRTSVTAQDYGVPAEGSVLPNPNGRIPRNRYLGNPSEQFNRELYSIGYDLEHRFSENWEVHSVFQYSQYNERVENAVQPSGLQDDRRTLDRFSFEGFSSENIYNLDNYVTGRFKTGSISHQLVAGINLFKRNFSSPLDDDILPGGGSIDIFNPTYTFIRDETVPFTRSRNNSEGLGLYLQNQISFAENFKVLLGGRFDIASQEFENLLAETQQFKQDEAFSPQIGIVYQPVKPVSLYASYSQSFEPPALQFSGQTSDGNPLQPERGTQFEVGVKADLSARLSATLAFYNLTRTNVPTRDPNDDRFTIQVGEQRSRGIELDISGELLPGWNIITGYALTDAVVTEDNTITVGNRLINVPKHSFNLWTTYSIQTGVLQGLGFGLGVFYVGERAGDTDNSFELPGYVRTDAAIFYNRNNFRAAINFKNLFNVDYFQSSQNRFRVYYGDPFTVQGTVSWQF